MKIDFVEKNLKVGNPHPCSSPLAKNTSGKEILWSSLKILTIIIVVFLTMPSATAWSTTTKSKYHKTHYQKYYQSHRTPKHASKKNRQLHSHRPSHVKHASLPAVAINHANLGTMCLPGYLLSKAEKKVIQFVRKTISSIRYNTYKLGGEKIDINRGIYVVDCSRYVDHILKNTYPNAFGSLTEWSGTERPTTNDFYQYFSNLTDDAAHWDVIEEVGELRPGDILVFRNKNRRTSSAGHVMIVMDKPMRDGNVYLVRIADAAPSGHSKDTRIAHTSGIGIGTLLLKANPHTLKPHAYAWKFGSRWENNVNFAMARPRLGDIEIE